MTALSTLDPARQDWMQRPGLQRILAAIAKAGGEARFVGGAVRDALAGRAVGDIDLAVNLPPEKVVEALKQPDIRVVPTGIDHGTITAVADHKGYEITSLRHDVETDGRRARVAFTDDWQADASRRDFTFNALYADRKGKIYDYFGGQKDLAQGRVRFIGDAEARIKEDVLRILRFFRFYAWFGKGAVDAGGLKACRKLAGLMPQLSAERVWKECIKLLAAPDPVPAWRLMVEQEILMHAFPEAFEYRRLEKLLAAEKKYEAPVSPLLRLAALLPPDADVADKLARRLKLSNREAAQLHQLAALPKLLKGRLDPLPFRRLLYQYGPEACADAALLYAADQPAASMETVLRLAAEWEKPVFPLQGEDLLRLGVPEGPKVGEVLRAVEEWWQASDFKATKQECLGEAKKLIGT